MRRIWLTRAVGVAFLASGLSKLVLLDAPGWRATLVWRILGQAEYIAVLICWELLLGALLCVGVWPRVVAWSGLATLLVFSVVVAFDGPLAERVACGCAGGFKTENRALLLVRNLVYSTAIVTGTLFGATGRHLEARNRGGGLGA